MRYFIALVAIVGLLGFAGFVHAADPQTGKTAPKKGVFEKLDGKNIVYKGGVKGTGKDWYFVSDEKTVVTVDGKEAKLADLKAGQELTFTLNKDLVVTKLVATSVKDAPVVEKK